MGQMNFYRELAADLVSKDGRSLPVTIALHGKRLPGELPHDVEIKLISGWAPDGEYDLKYFHFRGVREQVRIEGGKFASGHQLHATT
jgi:hypothetical protein